MPATVRRIGLIILTLTVVHTLDRAAAADPPAEVRLKTVSYRELGDAVRHNAARSSSLTCGPTFARRARSEFPNLVQLHQPLLRPTAWSACPSLWTRRNRQPRR